MRCSCCWWRNWFINCFVDDWLLWSLQQHWRLRVLDLLQQSLGVVDPGVRGPGHGSDDVDGSVVQHRPDGLVCSRTYSLHWRRDDAEVLLGFRSLDDGDTGWRHS